MYIQCQIIYHATTTRNQNSFAYFTCTLHIMFCLQRYISLLFLVHYLLHIYSIYWNQFSHNLLLRGSTTVTRFNRNSDSKFVYVLVSIVTVFPVVKKVLFVLKYRKCLKSDSQKNLETQSYWKRKYTRFCETF